MNIAAPPLLTSFAVTSQITKFSPTSAYFPENMTEFFYNPSIKQAWLDLVPMGLGYIDIVPLSPETKASLHDLPAPVGGFPLNQTVYTTSVTHQLHCLYSITHSYAAAKTGIEVGHGHEHGHRRRDDTEDEDEALIDIDFHVQHCFEYLRQSIMCSGDMALEGDQTTFPEGFTGSDGWDAKHVCRDWNQIYDHLRDKRANDLVWIA
jgi:hypothetical protein